MSETQPMTMYKTPKQTLLVVMKAGVAKGISLWWQLLALGFHAGVFIGFGAGLVITVAGGLDATVPSGFKKLIAGVIFPVCLILIVISGSELFTGNVMYLLTARMAGQTTWRSLFKNWFFSYFGNLCGALAVAYFLFHLSDQFASPNYVKYLHDMAISKTEVYTFGEMVLKGIGCNYLVCLSLWCAAASDDITSKIFSIWWPLMAFVTIGFEHSIANMFYVPMAIMNGTGNVTAADFIVKNLIPVTIGNIMGGAMFAFVQYLIYHPYIEADVAVMQIKQGRVRNNHNESMFEMVEEGKKQHQAPTYENTMFARLANYLWYHYCMFMKDVVGIIVYSGVPPTLHAPPKRDYTKAANSAKIPFFGSAKKQEVYKTCSYCDNSVFDGTPEAAVVNGTIASKPNGATGTTSMGSSAENVNGTMGDKKASCGCGGQCDSYTQASGGTCGTKGTAASAGAALGDKKASCGCGGQCDSYTQGESKASCGGNCGGACCDPAPATTTNGNGAKKSCSSGGSCSGNCAGAANKV